MIRKLLTIISLVGLLLSVGLWGASYSRPCYTWSFAQRTLELRSGGAAYQRRHLPRIRANLEPRFGFNGFESLGTEWRFYNERGPRFFRSVFLPMWMPTLAFATLLGSCLYLSSMRRRKRKKLELCLRCGYDLRGSEERCPECGTSFGEVMMFSRRHLFVPRFSGELEFRALPDDLVAALESRIQEGFLVRGNHVRSNYRICSSSNDRVTIRADDWWTAINIGLNEVRLRREGGRRITFEVSFWRWTGYAAMLGILIFTPLLGIFVFTDWMKPWLPSNLLGMLGSLSIGVFFCLCWPWILTEFHKKPAARCLERILHETFMDLA